MLAVDVPLALKPQNLPAGGVGEQVVESDEDSSSGRVLLVLERLDLLIGSFQAWEHASEDDPSCGGWISPEYCNCGGAG